MSTPLALRSAADPARPAAVCRNCARRAQSGAARIQLNPAPAVLIGARMKCEKKVQQEHITKERGYEVA